MRGVRASRDVRDSAAAPIDDDEAAKLFSLWNDAPATLIAVSGGPDSIALLGLAARWRAGGAQTRLISATFDHRLRPDSAAEAEAVAAFAETLGVDHRILRWTGEKPSSAVQEKARAARYDALLGHALAEGASHLALAHHQDDQAETVLMRLAAGSGVGGLGGMSETSRRGGVTLHRPFLALTKERLIATCRAHGWPFVEDPSNGNDRFARARWRAVAPHLAAEGLTSRRLAVLAARARRAEEALESMVDAWLAAHPAHLFRDALILRANDWAAAPTDIRIRILGRLIDRIAAGGDDPAPERLERLERLEEELREAAANRRPLSRNLRGVLARLDRTGALTFAPEPPRRRTARSS